MGFMDCLDGGSVNCTGLWERLRQKTMLPLLALCASLANPAVGVGMVGDLLQQLFPCRNGLAQAPSRCIGISQVLVGFDQIRLHPARLFIRQYSSIRLPHAKEHRAHAQMRQAVLRI